MWVNLRYYCGITSNEIFKHLVTPMDANLFFTVVTENVHFEQKKPSASHVRDMRKVHIGSDETRDTYRALMME